MKKITLALVIFLLVVTAGNTLTEDMVIVSYGGTVVDRFHRADYVNMMIYLRWCQQVSTAEQNNGVHLILGTEGGCRIEWHDAQKNVIKSINFHSFEGETGE
jgi:hypothetical protein